MPRPINIQILPQNITHNLNVLKQRQQELYGDDTSQKIKHWAVVKANAYGHKIENIYQGLCDAQLDGIALLDFKEAITLRELGWDKPILLLEGTFYQCIYDTKENNKLNVNDWQLIHKYHLTTTIHSLYQLEQLQSYLTENPDFLAVIQKTGVFVKINTGMNRLGFKNELQLQSVIQQCRMLNIPITLSTHFANADSDDKVEKILPAIKQWQAFVSLKHQFLKFNESSSVNNSAGSFQGVLNFSDIPEVEMVHNRYGIMMYGSSSFAHSSGKIKQTAKEIGLKPTMILSSQVIALLDVGIGEQVGYGSQFWAVKPMKISVVACGYADGYPRHAPTGTPIAVNGEITQLIGRVSMDMITVDVTDIHEKNPVQIGDVVQLWGDIVPIDDVAHHAKTIAYELMCAVAPRVWEK
jgi:alanine racemase